MDAAASLGVAEDGDGTRIYIPGSNWVNGEIKYWTQIIISDSTLPSLRQSDQPLGKAS